MNKLRELRFEIILGSLVILLLTPLLATIFRIDMQYATLTGLSILAIASLILAVRRIPRLLTGVLGLATLLLVWTEFIYAESQFISLARMWSMLGLYISLAYILIRNFMDAKDVSPRVIFGAISGFILIGFLGGILFELLSSYQEGSILVDSDSGGYDLYYYSFISLMTVGYGDIIPLTGAAKSLTVVISLCGQLYMTIGIAIFVGKHLNKFNKPK